MSQGNKDRGGNEPTSISRNLRRIKGIIWKKNRAFIGPGFESQVPTSITFYIV
jgi:hypothetical protein